MPCKLRNAETHNRMYSCISLSLVRMTPYQARHEYFCRTFLFIYYLWWPILNEPWTYIPILVIPKSNCLNAKIFQYRHGAFEYMKQKHHVSNPVDALFPRYRGMSVSAPFILHTSHHSFTPGNLNAGLNLVSDHTDLSQ